VRAVLLDGAQGDIRELRQYLIKLFGQSTWQPSYESVKATIRTLTTYPESGGTPPELIELGLTQYRQALCGTNRIIYEVQADVLYIHIVCDTRRDLHTLLARRLLSREY
jgi:toxin ParE1/3/4